MASGPSLHGKLVGKKWRQWRILFSWLPNSLWMVTAATKLTFVPWKKSYEQPRQLIKRQRDMTLPTKVCIVKTVVFPVVMYGCESWTIKKAEHWGIDAFQLCWRKLLSLLDSREIKPVNPKGNQPWIFIGRIMLKLQYLGHLMRSADSLEKTLMLGKIEGRRRRGRQRMRWDGWMSSLTQWTWIWVSSGRWWRTGKPGVLQSMRLQRVGHDLVTEQQQTDRAKIRAPAVLSPQLEGSLTSRDRGKASIPHPALATRHWDKILGELYLRDGVSLLSSSLHLWIMGSALSKATLRILGHQLPLPWLVGQTDSTLEGKLRSFGPATPLSPPVELSRRCHLERSMLLSLPSASEPRFRNFAKRNKQTL